MNPDIIPLEIQRAHALYQAITRTSITLDWTRLDAWRVFLKFRKPPFSESDLRIVVSHLKSERKGSVLTGSLKFHNLIGRPDYFEEDLNIALQGSRPKAPAFKEHLTPGTTTKRIMPVDGSHDAAVPIAEVIRKMREAAEGRHT